jgi:predicted GTPase
MDYDFLMQEMKVPPILYIANKSENNFEGDVLADFYSMFPHVAEEQNEPIFLSAEHGDGLVELYQGIHHRIPVTQYSEHKNRQEQRIDRFRDYKQMLLDELIETKEQ